MSNLAERLAYLANTMTHEMSQGGNNQIVVTPEMRDDLIAAYCIVATYLNRGFKDEQSGQTEQKDPSVP